MVGFTGYLACDWQLRAKRPSSLPHLNVDGGESRMHGLCTTGRVERCHHAIGTRTMVLPWSPSWRSCEYLVCYWLDHHLTTNFSQDFVRCMEVVGMRPHILKTHATTLHSTRCTQVVSMRSHILKHTLSPSFCEVYRHGQQHWSKHRPPIEVVLFRVTEDSHPRLKLFA